VQGGEPDLPAAQVADHGDQVLQGAGKPVECGDDEGVPGLHEPQRGGQLGPVGVLAGPLVGEDPAAAGPAEGVELPVELLPSRRHPGVPDPDAGQRDGLGCQQQAAGFWRRVHARIFSENGHARLLKRPCS